MRRLVVYFLSIFFILQVSLQSYSSNPQDFVKELVNDAINYLSNKKNSKEEKASFIVTPDKIFKNDKLYYDGPAMIVWPAGIFHRIISGEEGSISINFSTRTNKFNLDDNFNIYNLNIYTGEHHILKEGSEDQPDFYYKYPNKEIEELAKGE